MRTRACILAAGLTVTAAFLAFHSTQAGGGKDVIWKPVVPAEAVKELIAREAKIIEDLAGDKLEEQALDRIKLGGAIIVALIFNSKDGDSPEARTAGLKINELAGKKGNNGAEIKKLAAGLSAVKLVSGKGEGSLANLGLDKASLMDHFRTKMKGGDGLHPTLQSSIPLKGTLNGVEEKLRALAKKKMMPANLEKEADELALLGFRSAVVGELTYFYAPAKTAKKDPAVWRESALTTRDAGFELAEAAKKKDVDGVFRASTTLSSACSRCHIDFRN